MLLLLEMNLFEIIESLFSDKVEENESGSETGNLFLTCIYRFINCVNFIKFD